MLDVLSEIRDVTVFREGAELTRVASLVADDEGSYPDVVYLGPLPLSLEDDSLRARVVAEGEGAAPVATDLRVELSVTHEEIETQGTDVAEKFRELDAREVRLKTRAEFLKRSFDRIGSLEPRPRAEPGARSPLPSRRKLIEFRQRELLRLQKQGREVDEELQQVARQRTALRSRGPAPATELFKRVVIRLKTPAQAAPRARLELTYRTPGARWAPAYAFRLDRDLTMVDVLMRVLVCQATGEDWSRVRLSVSTADPVAWKDLPELPTWRIGKRQPSPARAGWRPPPAGTDTLFADFDRARKTAPAVVAAPPPTDPEPEPEPFPEDVFGEVDDPFGPADPFAAAADPFAAAVADPFGAPAADPFAAAADPFGAMPDPFGAAPSADPFADNRALRASHAPSPPARAGLMRAGAAAPGGARRKVVTDKPMLGRAPSAEMSGKPMLSRARPQYLGSADWQSQWEPTVLEVGREHLTYSSLRMPGPEEHSRGKLRPQDVVEAALFQLKRRGLEPTINLRQAIQSAQHRARSVVHLGLQAGHLAPGPVEGFDYLYPGDGLVDLPGDAQWHSLPLLVRSLPARAEYVTVPRVTSDIFRVVEIESLPDLALPGGPADIYVGDDFLIGTSLPHTGPGGTIRLGLGVEQGLKVARNTSYKETTAGMMGGTAQLRHTVTIELNNRLDREVRVQVQERLPEPAKGQEEIKVKVEEVKPSWDAYAPPEAPHLKSCYRWMVKVDPQSRMSLKVTYTIEIPSKLELQGGNRREA